MNKDDIVSECDTSCVVKSKYFSKETVMDDSSSDFQEKKTYSKGPKNVQKSKVSKPKKPLKKKKGQRDIRTLIKNKNSELVSYSKNFNQVCKESGVDVDSEQLQLAIALSKSLHDVETKSDDNLQESKPLTSQERTAKIRTTLQEYGFRVPNTKISKDLSKRRKFKKQYKLLLASGEEKHQNISDKYAEVLAKNIHKSPLKSNKLNNYNDQEIFYKATNIVYEFMRNDDMFYIKELFEKPLTKSCLLREWSTIPGRPASPKREERNFNFDNIECTQDELDVILSGSILAAQSIMESKHINSCAMDISNKNSPTKVIDAECVTISINNELEELSNTNSHITMKANYSEAINFIDTKSMVSQKVRSVSPDIFDDDISYTFNDINNPIAVLKENVTQSNNNITDFMDLTECVNIAPERDKTKNITILSIKEVSMKSNDLMEITECVPTTAKECIENIDLTQSFNHSKTENYSNNIETDNFEMDLTQSSNSNIDLPEETEEVTTKEIGSKTNSEYDKYDYDTTKNDCEEQNIHIEIKESLSPNANNIENIDLTQSFNHSKIESHADKLKMENFEMDLTQSSNSDIDLPEESIGAKQTNSLDETILDNEFVKVIPNQVLYKETLSSPTNSKFVNDYNTKTDNVNQNVKNQIVKHKDNNSHLYEQYTNLTNSFKNTNKEKFEISASLSKSPKQTIIENIDLTQSFNYLNQNHSNSTKKINITKRKSNDLMEITECVPTSTKLNLIENIDLTQGLGYSERDNYTNNILEENLQIYLTKSLHSNKISPLAGLSSNKTKISLNKSVVVIGETVFNSDINKEALIFQNDSEFENLRDNNRTEDIFKPRTIHKNCKNLGPLKNQNKYEDNDAHFSHNCKEINLNKENDTNLEMDLTQSSDSDNDPLVNIDAREKEISSDDTVLITKDTESNLDSVVPKDSELACNDFNKSKEKNKLVNSHHQNVYTDIYDSYVFDHNNFYDHDNLSKSNSQDKIVIENFSIDSKIPSYTEHNTHLLNNSDKINEDKSHIEEFDNIDLTQNSHSSNEVGENHCDPIHDTNIGKIDNISIDYDEIFDDIVTTKSQYASNSLQPTNTSNDSIRKANNSNSEASTNPSKTSDCFEISDKEFNYSLHHSRHNFDIGGLSVLDNVSDFKLHSNNDKSRHSKTNLNRSLSDSDLPSASVKKLTVHTPKSISNSNNLIHETSTPVINKCLIQEVQNTPKNCEYIIKTHNVTPMQDYESMTSPERNRELEKYGLKPFKRKRAIQLLKHLYEQTHPVVESCDIEQCSSPSKRRKYDNGSHRYYSPGKTKSSPRKSPKKCLRSPRKHEFNLVEADKENVLYKETKNAPDIKELKCIPEDWVFQKREKAKVHSCKVPLHIAFHNYVSCRQLLREAILRYEPINIDVIHKDLVACGYKYNPKDLLRFLDKKCITVKTADNNSRNRKS